ncbi:YwhD family protein [Alicyclobacillus mali]|uniref:YwhD family protein n=1 Tax=Alicyclobacillus mali (ex Roth et al. 2021) TaxID=1123961 RepID=A0ABS0F1A3_9BACL|nr:YwhD family protein [Alicyclobacillus mali (ex Roth et al. 2021)]MBF8377045.1 YwhD family protein [Alicyclobacillus mali (ex Roth et al. 2021)]MCL6488360.1 YwhD family protein [Alicyclobacillus mali (ex Roth et al. 2021)]
MQKLGLTGQSKQPHTSDDQLKGISAVLMDGDEIFIDNNAIHAKSRVEVGIRFVGSLEEVPHPRRIVGLWVSLKRFENGMGFNGVQAIEMWIDSEAQLGYKKLADHVNAMDKAVKGKADLSLLSSEQVEKFAAFLRGLRPDLWENASPAFREAFSAA